MIEAMIMKNPDCFRPEEDNPYPLCIGGKVECEDCCLYVDYEKKHNPWEKPSVSGNPCLNCDCYYPDFGCIMPSVDLSYACPLEHEPDWVEILK